MKNVGKPCKREAYARIDGGRLETERRPRSPRWHRLAGNRRNTGLGTYRRTTPPRQSPTLHRHAVSSKVFNSLDDHVWRLTYKWAKFTHPHKSKHWVVARYFGAFNSARKDRWVFGDRDSGAYLLKFSWANITRHTLVKGWASPDDPTLASYWEARRRRGKPALGRARLRLLQAQHGLCPLCGDLLLYADHEPRHPDEWEQWITATGKAIRRQALVVTGPGTPGERTVHRLIHTHCRRRQPNGNGSAPAPQLRP